MSIDALGFLPPVGAALPTTSTSFTTEAAWLPSAGAPAARTAGPDFASWLRHSAEQTNRQLLAADEQVTRLALGETDNLHRVMIALDEAKLSFQLMVQVRNKLLEAYQDVLRMQV